MRRLLLPLMVFFLSFSPAEKRCVLEKIETVPTTEKLIHYIETVKQKEVKELAQQFNMNMTVAESIWKASIIEKVDPYLIASLIYTESSFDPEAVSPKNYHGLAQIPYRIPYIEANILIGIKILKEKIQIAEKRLGKKIRSLLDVTEMTPEERLVLMESIRLYKGYVRKKHMTKGITKARKVIDLALLKKATANET